MTDTKPVRLQTLQIGRGLAAIAVLMHHAEQSVSRMAGKLPEVLRTLLSFGYLGVDFFFVLSGFIIYYVSHDQVGRPGWPLRYLESRVSRVYVPYLPIGIAVALAYMIMPGMSSGQNNWNWFSTLTLLPSAAGPALAPAWTLQHEIIFYGVAFVFLYLRKVLWGCLVMTAVMAFYHLNYRTGFKSFSAVDLEFVFGIFVAWCYINNRLRLVWLPVASGLALCALYFLIGGREFNVVFGLGLACMLLPVVRAEAAARFRCPALLITLGEASYAIYLVHYPMLSVLVRAMRGFPPVIALLIAVLLPVVAGLAYHRLFEIHALRQVRGWLHAKPKALQA